MASRFVNMLDEEIAEVEAELASNPLYARLRKLLDLRKDYTPEGTSAQPAPLSRAASIIDSIQRTGRRVSPEREQATRYAREILEGRSEPVRMDEIYGYVASKGVQIGGQDPKSNLSAMLSKTDGFIAHGRTGWTYHHGAKKNEAPADRHPQGASEYSGESGSSPEPAQNVRHEDIFE